jgi:hypothetical protein
MLLKFFSTNNLTALEKAQLLEILTKGDDNLHVCLSNCSNRGLCVLENFQKYACKCVESFYVGASCEIDARPCSNYPCLNNGTCVLNDLANQTICQCKNENFFGKFCENRVNLCQNETCSFHGYCIDNTVKEIAECKCFKSYFGLTCEQETYLAKYRKAVQYMALTVLILCMVTFVFLIVGNDILNCFGVGENIKVDLKEWKKKLRPKDYERKKVKKVINKFQHKLMNKSNNPKHLKN